MEEREYDAFLITDTVNIFYLSRFYHMATERPAALLVPVDDEPIFMGPRLEVDHLRHQTPIIEVVHSYLDYPGEKHPIVLFAGWIREHDLGEARIAADNPDGASGGYGYQGPSLRERLPGATIENEKQHIYYMRIIKTEEELDLIRESAKWGNLAHQLLQDTRLLASGMRR